MDETLEARIRALHEKGDFEGALTVALEGYGREVMGFLYVRTGDETAAGDVFSVLAEDLWKGIEGFSWRSSFRTWMYVLARNAASRHGKKRARGEIPISKISEVAEKIRTETLFYLRTEAKDRLDELRASLDREDQELIVLRVKRNLSWNEIAEILAGDTELDEAATKRAAAKHRQRFRTVKERLRERASKAGIVPRDR